MVFVFGWGLGFVLVVLVCVLGVWRVLVLSKIAPLFCIYLNLWSFCLIYCFNLCELTELFVVLAMIWLHSVLLDVFECHCGFVG